jgi:chromosome segregation ATPase
MRRRIGPVLSGTPSAPLGPNQFEAIRPLNPNKEPDMQITEIKERFSRVERCIDLAAQACQNQGDTPQDLKNTLSELDRQSDELKLAVNEGEDEDLIRQEVEDLEELGDRAVRACKQAGNLDPQLRDAVQQAHDAISELKHQLH